ncbi:troponin C, isoallergen Bla g 6.0301 [Bacillus rossius redtenbacheri]|uniref:troponin C, isoallergen Bla g 6.0301 n=1 Tax=Bacillus rossius redtenbacheri TaxID=93214 RepID=UPI002FDC900F
MLCSSRPPLGAIGAQPTVGAPLILATRRARREPQPARGPSSDFALSLSLFADMAEELPPEQIAVLRKAFDAFDREKQGSIPCNLVEEILRLMGQPFNRKILEELIDEVDADKSGRLEFEEFITLAAKFIVEEDAEAMEKELREAFRLYDKEGNGYIPTTCLREILRELDDQLTEQELDMMIEEIDSDGSGTVDFDEFMEMMTG